MEMYKENEKKVQTILERGVGILARNYGVRKLDAGDFSAPVTLNTQFRIAHYEIENVGHLMTMYTENNPQLLMATYTLTPYYKKLPLISSDFIFNGDGGMFLIEIYELVKDREAASFQAWIRKYAERFRALAEIENIPTEPCFYDPVRPVYVCKKRFPGRDQDAIQNLIDIMKIFIAQEKSETRLENADAAEQEAIQRKFVDDLIDQNGVSTRVWVQEHGADYVRRFFHEIFFGV